MIVALNNVEAEINSRNILQIKIVNEKRAACKSWKLALHSGWLFAWLEDINNHDNNGI